MVLFIFFCLIYGFRFIYYYKLEHPKVVSDSRLSTKIIENNPLVSTNTSLKNIESDYVFSGNVENNYVFYSNQLWRILKINEDRTITLINDDVISNLAYSNQNSTFENSYVYSWLQEYYNFLNQPDHYLVEKDFCIDVGKTREENCKKTFSSKIGLLSYYNYVEAGANNGYLNIGKYFWTLTPSSSDKIWYVFKEGGMNDKSYSGDTYYSYGIRPVITLKSDISYQSGNGSKDSPYVFEEKEELGVGSYIHYSDSDWRIIKKDDESFYLALNDILDQTHIFSNNSSLYQRNDYNSIYYYLNNIYYKTLDQTLLLDGTWYIGEYSSKTGYDYRYIYKDSVVSKVGLVNVADFFTSLDADYISLTSYSDDLIHMIKSNGSLYSLNIDEKGNIRPVIRITNQISVISGVGTKDDPYVVGGK